MQNHNSTSLSLNRTEEFGFDLWEHFVIPPYYNELDLLVAKKPRVIIGGRGCGKTMLLRYLSHQTMFSPKRAEIKPEFFSHIGLYWRMDTGFVSSMTKRGVEEDVWQSAFIHLAALMIGGEILKSLDSITNSNFETFNADDVQRINFSSLKNYQEDFPDNQVDLKKFIRNKFMQFEGWLNNVRSTNIPYFLPKGFIDALIQDVKLQVPCLNDSTFFVYLDEYENLLPYQQRIVNTWVKHSEMPLIFNLAMKRNSFDERRTIGNESLTDIQDYRTHDLEDFYITKFSFSSFAAEILFSRLAKDGYKDLPIEPSDLRDLSKLSLRNSKEYTRKIEAKAESIFLGFSKKEHATNAINDPIINQRIKELIKGALDKKRSKYTVDDFYFPDLPEAMVVTPSILYRKNSPEDVRQELLILRNDKRGKYAGDKGWIHNYFYGCFILLFDPLNRTCPLYSSYDTFCKLSHGNLRHLLELCFKSLSAANISSKTRDFVIEQRYQYEAAKQTSHYFLRESKNFGPEGNKLYAFINRLGYLFQQSQKRLSQSEAEVTHFSIKRTLYDSQGKFDYLKEAVKWSVLFEEKSTKKKSDTSFENFEYVLNPIYAPAFSISYRKGRKLEITNSDYEILMNGDLVQYGSLLNRYIKKWGLSSEDDSPLFLTNND